MSEIFPDFSRNTFEIREKTPEQSQAKKRRSEKRTSACFLKTGSQQIKRLFSNRTFRRMSCFFCCENIDRTMPGLLSVYTACDTIAEESSGND